MQSEMMNLVPRRRGPMLRAVFAVFATFAFGAVACGSGGGDDGAQTGEESNALTVEHDFSGNTNSATTSWQTFPFTAQVGDTVSATLDWDNPAANLNVYLYDPTGKVVAYENSTTAKPSATTTTAVVGGNWKVAMKCGSSSASFTIKVSVGAASRFPGDPGRGNIYLGAARTSQAASAFPQLESELQGHKFGMARLYFSDAIGWSTVDDHMNAGRIPAVSFKTGSRTLANIASGAEDAWIDDIGAHIAARAPKPLFMTFYHEPEDNFPSAQDGAEYRAATRRIVTRWRASNVKNFTFVADYFMTSWTFAGSGRDWRNWYPDWKGTTAAGSSKDSPNIADFDTGTSSVVDVIGYDIYNWWQTGDAASKWKSFQQEADYGILRHKLLGKPACVGEYGTMAYEQGGTIDAAKTTAWFNDAYDYMIKNDFVCAMYWDNHFTGVWDPRLDTNDPQKVRLGALSGLLGRSTTATPKL